MSPTAAPARIHRSVVEYEADCERAGVCDDWRTTEDTPGGVLYCDRPHGHVGKHTATHPMPYTGDATWVW